MTAFLIRRAAFAVVTLFAVLTLVFVDRAHSAGRSGATHSRRSGLARGDRGAARQARARSAHRPAISEFPRQRACAATGACPWSPASRCSPKCSTFCLGRIDLTLVSLALGVALGVPLGVWAAVRRNRFVDYVVRDRLACGAFLSRLCLRHHPLVPVRHRIALVPGDLRAQRQLSKPGRSRSRCRRSASASTPRPTSPA